MLTIPVTSAGAELSFSKLKLIENYLRSNLSQHNSYRTWPLSASNKVLPIL